MSDELDDVLVHVDQFLRRKFPGEVLDELHLLLRSGRTLKYSAFGVPPDRTRLGKRHSADFRSVNWYGREFVFSPKQSAVVEALWKADADGTPELGQATLLADAEAETDRLRDLFRHNPAWGVVIVPGRGKDTFRLGSPPADLDELM